MANCKDHRLNISTFCGAALICGLVVACVPHSAQNQRLNVNHDIDVSVGSVSSGGALIWVGGEPGATLALNWHGNALGGNVAVTLDRYGTAHVKLDALTSATKYTLNVQSQSAQATARFQTAPAPNQAAPVHFIFSGDLAGQNACRDAHRGFPIFDAMTARQADLFVGLGDMIYADGTCNAVGPFGNAQVARQDTALTNQASFMGHWRYNQSDAGFRKLRRSLVYEPVWDDHEIINDFGPTTAHRTDAPLVDLLAPGRAAFIANNPVLPASDTPNRLFRSIRYGAHAELFLLDTRQYRDHNAVDDTGVLPKSLLGAQQRRWLLENLGASSATWKFVVSSVPIAIPTGWPVEKGRDGWASGDGDDGFERELYAIFQTLADKGVERLVWLSADVHFATGLELRPLPHQSSFVVRELVVGPLSAGIYPTQVLDDTFSPTRLFFHGPESPPTSLDEALRFYNFGDIVIDARGTLTFSLINGHGEVVDQRRWQK